MSSGQLPYPHVGTRTALISLGGREGAEPQLVVIKHPAVGRDGQDINSPGVYGPEDSASQGKDRATTAGQRDASGGHLGNAPASTQGRWENQKTEKEIPGRGRC